MNEDNFTRKILHHPPANMLTARMHSLGRKACLSIIFLTVPIVYHECNECYSLLHFFVFYACFYSP